MSSFQFTRQEILSAIAKELVSREVLPCDIGRLDRQTLNYAIQGAECAERLANPGEVTELRPADRRGRHWTIEELDILRARFSLADTVSKERDLERELNRTWEGIYSKAKDLRLPGPELRRGRRRRSARLFNQRATWSAEQDAVLLDLETKRTPVREMVSRLGRSPDSIKARLNFLKPTL